MMLISRPEQLNTSGTVQLPLSKSESNRLIVIAALAGHTIDIEQCSDAVDTKLMWSLIKSDDEVIHCGMAGTVARFLTAYFAAKTGVKKTITGDDRLLKRPIKDLVEALNSLGANITHQEEEGCLPISVEGKRLVGGTIDIDASVSSQFISALMMIAPGMQNGLKLNLIGEVVSASYIRLTSHLMRQQGMEVEEQPSVITIPAQSFNWQGSVAGADWSSAAFWYALAAMNPALTIALEGLDANSMQGERAVMDIFESLGVRSKVVKNGIEISGSTVNLPAKLAVNCSSFPDLVPALVVSAAAVGVQLTVHGVAHLRHKESDRIEALTMELAKMNVQLNADGGSLEISGEMSQLNGENLVINTYNDHRMAMAFAPLAVKLGKIAIQQPEVVEKSYPNYWEELTKFLLINHSK